MRDMFQLRCFLVIRSTRLANQVMNNRRDLKGKQGRHCVADLNVLLGPVPTKQVVVWECLKPGRLSDCQASALLGVRMYVVVPILRYVRCDGRSRLVRKLHSESISEILAPGHGQVDITVLWEEFCGKVHQLRRPAVDGRE